VNLWQASIATSLTLNGLVGLIAWWRMHRTYQPHSHLLTPLQRRVIGWGWVVALVPAFDAWALWMGGFF